MLGLPVSIVRAGLTAGKAIRKLNPKITDKKAKDTIARNNLLKGFHDDFKKTMGRNPKKSEFDALLSQGTAGYRPSKNIFVRKNLGFMKEDTPFISARKSEFGKLNKITDPDHVSPGTAYTRRRRAKRDELDTAEVRKNVDKYMSVNDKNYNDLAVVPGYKANKLKPGDMTMSHGATNLKTNPENARIAAGRLNSDPDYKLFRKAEDDLQELTLQQEKMTRGKTPKQLKEISEKVEKLNSEKLDIILGKGNEKISRRRIECSKFGDH